MESNIEEELPYDVKAAEITFWTTTILACGIWTSGNIREKYEGKKITFKGQVYRNQHIPGRTRLYRPVAGHDLLRRRYRARSVISAIAENAARYKDGQLGDGDR